MIVIDKNGLKISSNLFEFINKEILPGTDIKSDDFWLKFEEVVHEIAPINKNKQINVIKDDSNPKNTIFFF